MLSPGWRAGRAEEVVVQFRRNQALRLKCRQPLAGDFPQIPDQRGSDRGHGQSSRPCEEFSIRTGCPLATDNPIRPTEPCRPTRFPVVCRATTSRCSMTSWIYCGGNQRRRCPWPTSSCRSYGAREPEFNGAGSGIPMPMRVRKIIVQTISPYARRTHNWSLLHLIDRVQNPDAVPARQQPPAPRPPKPDLSPDEQDYRSIVDVLEKNNRSVSMAVLGKSRRRWLERPPTRPEQPAPEPACRRAGPNGADGVLVKNGTRTCRARATPDTLGRRSLPVFRNTRLFHDYPKLPVSYPFVEQ